MLRSAARGDRREQLYRMHCLAVEAVSFVDLMCQLNDMVKPEKEGVFTLRDIKKRTIRPMARAPPHSPSPSPRAPAVAGRGGGIRRGEEARAQPRCLPCPASSERVFLRSAEMSKRF